MADALKLPPPGFMTPKSKKRKRSESPESPGTPYSPAYPVPLDPFGKDMARQAQDEEELLARTKRGLVTPNRPTRKNEPPPLKRKGGRHMTRKYCKRTSCKKMGFSQKASCRSYKNCYTRRRRRV
jgi:hypothetical protein